MFPKSFNARVAERMAIWGAMLGFLAFLYGATEVIQAWKLAKLSDDAQRASAALSANANAEAALARIAARPPVGRIKAVLCATSTSWPRHWRRSPRQCRLRRCNPLPPRSGAE